MKGHQGGTTPTKIEGDAHKYLEREAKLAGLPVAVDNRIAIWVSWRQTRGEEVTTDAIELEFSAGAEHVKQVSSPLYSGLTLCLVTAPFYTPQYVTEGNGLEALRLLMNHYAPISALTRCRSGRVVLRGSCSVSDFVGNSSPGGRGIGIPFQVREEQGERTEGRRDNNEGEHPFLLGM